MKVRNGAVSGDSTALSPFCGMARVHARFAYPNPAEPRQTNAGDMRGWREALLHWLIEGLRYAAQAAAMREGHPWNITPRVALGTQDKGRNALRSDAATEPRASLISSNT